MKQKRKLKEADKAKIMNRYITKCEEFKSLTLEDLKQLYNNTKMSSTDRQALIKIMDFKLKEEVAIKAKEAQEHDNIEAE